MCELGNDHAGQFFTPYDVCRCMAEITFDPKLHPDMEGFISVSDPACGAGATLLAFLKLSRFSSSSLMRRRIVDWENPDLSEICSTVCPKSIIIWKPCACS